jgi:hypothetical protein
VDNKIIVVTVLGTSFIIFKVPTVPTRSILSSKI